MKEQIKDFSDEDIEAVAKFIAGHVKDPNRMPGQKMMPESMHPQKEKPCGM